MHKDIQIVPTAPIVNPSPPRTSPPFPTVHTQDKGKARAIDIMDTSSHGSGNSSDNGFSSRHTNSEPFDESYLDDDLLDIIHQFPPRTSSPESVSDDFKQGLSQRNKSMSVSTYQMS